MKPSFFLKTFLPVFAAIILVAGIAYAVWIEPTTAPPNGNVGAPINTSSTAQTKAGGFTAETLTAATVTGTTQFCLGASCITAWPSGGTAPAPDPGPYLLYCYDLNDGYGVATYCCYSDGTCACAAYQIWW